MNLFVTANNIYFMQGNAILPAFDALARSSFAAESRALNFTKNQEAAKTINDWVAAQTNNKIKDLIPAGDLDKDTRLVLVNAIYFLGNWLYPFSPEKTQKAPFYNFGTTAVTVDMMSIKNKFKYIDLPALNATAVDLAYKDSDISMLFILPNGNTGLKYLEENLKETSFADIVENMAEMKVNVQLPKFRIETQIELQATLKAVSSFEFSLTSGAL